MDLICLKCLFMVYHSEYENEGRLVRTGTIAPVIGILHNTLFLGQDGSQHVTNDAAKEWMKFAKVRTLTRFKALVPEVPEPEIRHIAASSSRWNCIHAAYSTKSKSAAS